MNDIEQKALALLNDALARNDPDDKYEYFSREIDAHEALCRAIEAHEAFRQEVSDALHEYIECFSPPIWHYLNKFIIPKPKSDPLVEVFEEIDAEYLNAPNDKTYANYVLAALEARGLVIREKTQ